MSDELNVWLMGGLSHNLLFFVHKAVYYISLSTRQAISVMVKNQCWHGLMLFSHLVHYTLS